MEVKYQVIYLDEVVKKDIPRLGHQAKSMVKTAIEERLMMDPVSYGKPLRYSLKGHRRLRVGDYRVVYRIMFEESQVLVVAIKHRREVYE